MRKRACFLGLAHVLCASGCSSNGGAERKAEAVEPPAVAVAQPTENVRVTEVQASSVTNGGATFDPQSVTPFFSQAPASDGAAQMALEKWSEARGHFIAALKTESDPQMITRLQTVVAVCEHELGNDKSAAKRFEKVASASTLLRNFAHLRAAQSYLLARKPKQAMQNAEKVASDSLYVGNATLLRADIMRGAGKWKDAAALYSAYLESDHKGHRLAEARFRFAEARERLGDPLLEVGLLYKEVTTKAVLSHWGRKAAKRTAAIGSRLRGSKSAKLLQLSAADRIHRGETYYRNHRNELSYEEFSLALKANGLDAENKCVASFNRANSVYKQRDRKRAAPLFEDAIAACNASKNVDLQVKSAYQAGRSYGLTSRSETAIARYLSIEKKHPTHSYADDARLRAAEEYRDINNQRKVTELLSSIPTKYPKGDMRAEAMWRLAWRAYKGKKYDEAIKWLNKQIEVKPIDENYWAEGQAQYWLGRAYGEQGKKKQSLQAYTSAIELYPLSYYALLAFNRVRTIDGRLFKALQKKIATPPADYDADASPFQFKPREVYASAAFHSALELLRLGLGKEAQAQLTALGFIVPAGKKAVADPDEIDKIWVMALLNHQAGRFGRSHWVTRWHVIDFKRTWPVGHNKHRWRIAYPIAWWELLSRHAKSHGYPPELIISFVREESAFNPLQESFANAIGLTQMIIPTAKRFARGTGISVSRTALRDPEKNVTIGSRFLNFLYQRSGGRVALLVPSYNAGEGATDRWLRYRGDWEMDAWAEEIPYDETRRYSKRVIATFFAYNYLGTGTIPTLPNDIPAAAVKKAKR